MLLLLVLSFHMVVPSSDLVNIYSFCIPQPPININTDHIYKRPANTAVNILQDWLITCSSISTSYSTSPLPMDSFLPSKINYTDHVLA